MLRALLFSFIAMLMPISFIQMLRLITHPYENVARPQLANECRRFLACVCGRIPLWGDLLTSQLVHCHNGNRNHRHSPA